MINKWEQDLPGLTDQGIRDRVALPRRQAADSLSRGLGRNPKAARIWRGKAAQAESELARRGLDH
jgi:hypothetical protein